MINCRLITDWEELATLKELLEPFYYMTKDLQGNMNDDRMCGAIFDVLPEMDMLLEVWILPNLA